MNTVLTPFPELLTFGILAPTLLRVTAAMMLIYIAYHHYKNRNDKAARRFPLLGDAMWIVWTALAIEITTAAALFFGYYTQYAALVGAALALKHLVWNGSYPRFFLLPRSTAILLLVITLSLLVTGAGAFAFDLPL